MARMLDAHRIFERGPDTAWDSDTFYHTTIDWSYALVDALVAGDVTRSELRKIVATAWVGEIDVVVASRTGFVPWEKEPVATLEVEATDRPEVVVEYGDPSELGGRWIVCGGDVFVGRGWWEE